MLYKNLNSSVSLSHGTSQRLNILQVIIQGCPISPFLFILAAEMLAILVNKDSNVEKLSVFAKQIGSSQLADETALFFNEHLLNI